MHDLTKSGVVLILAAFLMALFPGGAVFGQVPSDIRILYTGDVFGEILPVKK